MCSSRWSKLNSLNDPSIVALYGLARDISEQASGQWSHLRTYRNLCEHELLLVRQDTADADFPPWLKAPPPSISVTQLKVHAADMLRFTRAAMFYFAFFVRSESALPSADRKGPGIEFQKKALGKD